MARVNDGIELSEIERLVSEEHSEGLYHHDKLVGCVKRAHDIDVNLSAHVITLRRACPYLRICWAGSP